jgi:nucleoside-diphosphate-sugar epimerase
MSKKILVTGAAGFIGSHLAHTLAERGHSVTGVDSFLKFAGERRSVPSEGFELVELDLCDADLGAQLGKDWDEAYHLAAVVGVAKVCANPQLTIRNNAISTIRFLDWAREAVGGRVLFASSCENYASFYGTDLLPMPTPEDVYLGVRDIYNPRWSYAVSKILGELAFIHWDQEFSIVRYHNVYGPAMYSRHVIPEIFSKIWQDMNPLKVVSASQTRAFCHVRDAAEGTIAAMERDAAKGRVVNIGSHDEDITIGDLARRMVETSGRDIRVVDAEDLPGSVSRRRPDVRFMDELLGDHRFTSLEDGLAECWAWQEETGWVA